MRLLQEDEFAVTLELRRDELVAISNALNEVCHGPGAIEEPEFSTRIGATLDETKTLLSSLPGGGGADNLTDLR